MDKFNKISDITDEDLPKTPEEETAFREKIEASGLGAVKMEIRNRKFFIDDVDMEPLGEMIIKFLDENKLKGPSALAALASSMAVGAASMDLFNDNDSPYNRDLAKMFLDAAYELVLNSALSHLKKEMADVVAEIFKKAQKGD